MKKITVIVVLILCAANSFAQVDKHSRRDKNSAKFSLGVKAGIDYFSVKPVASYGSANMTFKDHVLQASWVAPDVFFEYSINPYFGIGIDAGWFQYNRVVNNLNERNGVYKGNTIDALLYASFNLSNIIKPYRSNLYPPFSIYANIGVGGGRYYNRVPALVGNGIEQQAGFTPLAMLSIDIAYNISDVCELFIEGQYRSYFNGNLGIQKTSSADFKYTDAIVGLIGFRCKIGRKNVTILNNGNIYSMK
ncbi:MAG: hypothetical protein LBN95_13310 [Prevotellaceae bacterium]|jgi:hypothetical protein|nr:hypothetical protein [Prevotellaceae bacterium]